MDEITTVRTILQVMQPGVSRIKGRNNINSSYIQKQRQEHAFGITGTALSSIRSYLSDRDQTVVVNGLKSEPFRLLYGVPQGSVIGPILFVLYTKPLDDILTATQYVITHLQLIPRCGPLAVLTNLIQPFQLSKNVFLMLSPG